MPCTKAVVPVFCSSESGLLFGCLEFLWNCLNNKIERIQNYALRVILRKPPLTSSSDLRQTLGWMTLKSRRKNTMLCQVHHCMKKQAPTYLSSKFITNSTPNHISTRGSSKIHLKRPLTNLYRSTFEFMGAQVYNTLPNSIRNINC